MIKIDLHVHSKFSKRPSQWILKRLGCPESFTEPLQIYTTAKKRGMSLVTITDHNTIAGALEIAHLPDTFVSEEITAYFPEDRCKVHVLAFDITENQHRNIQKVRENISDLADYLNQEQILHVVAHPLYGINERFSPEHFERLLLLFKNFELNGARNPEQNQLLRTILAGLTSEDIQRLAEKYDMTPKIPEPYVSVRQCMMAKTAFACRGESLPEPGSFSPCSRNTSATRKTGVPSSDTLFPAWEGISSEKTGLPGDSAYGGGTIRAGESRYDIMSERYAGNTMSGISGYPDMKGICIASSPFRIPQVMQNPV